MSYQYELLRPLRCEGAEDWNTAVFARACFGVEVTEPELAVRCTLGNLDPQHLGGRSDLSAIEAAVDAPLPTRGVTLATIRPDADAYGAMAVFTLRAEGRYFSPQMRGRIGLIGRADRFDHGQWPGPRPLSEVVHEIGKAGVGHEGLGALQAGLGLVGIEEGVRSTSHWILTGEAPKTWLKLSRQAAGGLFAAYRRGAVTVREANPSYISVVEGRVPGALRLGYQLAPVVVAVACKPNHQKPLSYRKVSIAQFNPDWLDLRRAAKLLEVDEPGWGGSATIIGSPQGIGSRLSIDFYINILRNLGAKHLILRSGG